MWSRAVDLSPWVQGATLTLACLAYGLVADRQGHGASAPATDAGLTRALTAAFVLLCVLVGLAPALQDRQRRRKLPPALADLAWSQVRALDRAAFRAPLPDDAGARRWARAHLQWWRAKTFLERGTTIAPLADIVLYGVLFPGGSLLGAILPVGPQVVSVLSIAPFLAYVAWSLLWTRRRTRLADARLRQLGQTR